MTLQQIQKISRKMVITFLSLLTIVLATFVIASIVCLLTGNVPRSYSVLKPSASTVIAGNTVPLPKLASMYKPTLFKSRAESTMHNSPPILTMWWEAIEAENSIVLVYHPVWKDERYPNPLLHQIYYIYRAIVYGIPVRDIEYIQIGISKSDGLIQRIRYEGSSSKFFNGKGEHVYITIDRNGTDYIETIKANDQAPNIRTLQISDQKLCFGIVNWSHQLVLLENDFGEYKLPVDVSIEYLDEENYVKYKLARRSQGDFSTSVGVIGRLAKHTIEVLVLGLPYLISRYNNI